ncbi:MAG: RNA 2',3'-cyclic phosphodiesterase [Prolixibacteraceae bacterium]|nr:RNA 2',3'-cyclic phosphodiesterase [Prolixibacteraceae bacterium]
MIKILHEISLEIEIFQVVLKGLDCFRKNNYPRVLFVKIENSLALKRLADRIENEVVSIGFKPEARTFNPHITLARIKRLTDLSTFNDIIERNKDIFIQHIKVAQIIFYQSTSVSSGVIYEPVETISLR